MSLHAGEIWVLWDESAAIGMDLHVISLADALRLHGRHPRILCLGAPTPALRQMAARQAMMLSAIPPRFSALRRRVRAGPPRLMHTHGPRAAVLGRLVGLATGVPVVSTLQAGCDGASRLSAGVVAERLSRGLARDLLALQSPADRGPPGAARQLHPFLLLGPRPGRLALRVALIAGPGQRAHIDTFCRLSAMVEPSQFAVYRMGAPEVTCTGRYSPPQTVDLDRGALLPWHEIGLLCLLAGDAADLEYALQAMAHGVAVAGYADGPVCGALGEGGQDWLVAPGNLAALARRINAWLRLDDADRRALSDRVRRFIAERYSPQTALPLVLGTYADAGA
jgi:hypothetical protein